MKRRVRLAATAALAVVVAALGGCGSSGGVLPLERQFVEIRPGETDVATVLNILPEADTLHTSDKAAVYRGERWRQELGIVSFDSQSSLVKRTDYVARRSSQWVPLAKEKLSVVVQTVVPQSLIEQPYENAMRKQVAILEFCHEALVADAEPFEEDQATVRMMGLARWALREGMVYLKARPREACVLGEADGFSYEHSVLGKCRMSLRQEQENQYTLELTAADWVDVVDTW